MRFSDVRFSRSWGGNPVVMLTLEKNENVDALIDIVPEQYEVEFKKIRKKRSLDSNGYFWQMVGKIAQATKTKSKEDIYRSYIRETGAYEIIPIREDALERWNQIWESKGEGWVTEDIGPCKNTKGYHNVKCYYGTSVYSTEEMAHLIDLVVQDAKELGIETMTPEEIERMKSLWIG